MKGCSKLSKAKLFPWWLVGWLVFNQTKFCGTLVLISLPQKLEAAVAKPGIWCRAVLLERWLKIPLVLVGALVLQHHQTDRTCVSMLEMLCWDWEMEKWWNCLRIASWEEPEEKWNSQSKAYLTQAMLFSRKKIYLIWRASKSRGHCSPRVLHIWAHTVQRRQQSCSTR